jgi:superfamily II DNA or RNA helicase
MMTDKTKEFLQKLKDSGNWNEKYDYSKIVYNNNTTNIIIIDEKGFEHEMAPKSLIKGNKLSILSVINKTKWFIELLVERYGLKFNLSKVSYVDSKTKVIIIDDDGFEHEMVPSNMFKKISLTIESAVNKNNYFIHKAKLIHGDKYGYSLINYVNSKTKIKIICPEHGEFEQNPSDHLNGKNCNKCSGKGKTNEEIIRDFKSVHGDKYDYSLVKYKNGETKIKIICPEHGEFKQRAVDHMSGSACKKCSGVYRPTTEEFIDIALKIHGDEYDYSKVNYINNREKVVITCKTHGDFNMQPSNHTHATKPQGCPKCYGKIKSNTKDFIEKAKNIHGDRYDYSLVNYINTKNKIKIICGVHGEYEQLPSDHLSGQNCSKCSGVYKPTTEEFIIKAKNKFSDIYDYSLVEYVDSKQKVKIKCSTHGIFEQTPTTHLKGLGCPICVNGYSKQYKLNLINDLEYSDLLHMDPFELYTIIGQGNLPTDFGVLAGTDADSDERLVSIRELRERLTTEEETDDATETPEDVIDVEAEPVDDVDIEITGTPTERPEVTQEPTLPTMREINDLHSLDNQLYASMDKEAFEALVQYKLRKLWNNVLNNEISLETLKNESGGQYFEMVKGMFFTEYDEATNYQPKEGYSFKFQPNLMQKLTVQRLLKAKSYGNWSGTGAGKTLSFIVASREVESNLTLIIALNSTIKQTCKVIKEVYPDSLTFSEYRMGHVFDRTKHNYLVLNYEKFQQTNSEELFQDLTNNNQIDFVVIDEVHNAKQREEGDENESIRRGVMTRLLGRIRENNSELYTLVMSATPVINNLFEAKSLLSLMTGLDYDDINTRRTLPNALKIFQQLILHGLRYIPKYDIEMTELTGSNMSNLNIDGGHLLDTLLGSSSNNYINTEKLLLQDKLKAIQPYLRKGVIIYSYLTTGFVDEIQEYVRALGYSTGTYTGEESTYIREENLNKFIAGDIDILIGSRPIGTGVDGLQDVCNRMILITLPWTDSEYTQLKGRIYRQGSNFGDVEIIIPQVRIQLEEEEVWSWDMQRLNLIRNKKTLADVAVDGVVPSRTMPSIETMYKKSQESLEKWKERINSGNIIESERQKLSINLYPGITDSEDRERRITSELSEFNRRGKTTLSTTMHKEFTDNPDSWFRYHKLRKERMDQWDEIPYEYIATKIRNRNHKIIDFGCGENLFRHCVPHNEVISFDHVAIDDSVIACDIKDVGEYVSNESVDVTIFSLALWGTNYKDYITEAHRVLNFGGVIHIAEPAKSYETPEDEQGLIDLITDSGFTIVGHIERRSKFIYITGIKM